MYTYSRSSHFQDLHIFKVMYEEQQHTGHTTMDPSNKPFDIAAMWIPCCAHKITLHDIAIVLYCYSTILL